VYRGKEEGRKRVGGGSLYMYTNKETIGATCYLHKEGQ